MALFLEILGATALIGTIIGLNLMVLLDIGNKEVKDKH
mgnify:FL=1|jgi:hypothetical protein